MKKITLFFLLSLFVTALHAESPIKLGLKAGYNSSKISIDSDQFKEGGSVNSYLAGAFFRLNMKKIYLQPEAYFNSKGGVLKEIDPNPFAAKNDFDLKTIDVPVLLGYKIYEKGTFNLRANAGPLMSFIIDKDIQGDDFTDSGLEDNFFGWQYGVGIDFLMFSLDARMESSSGDIYSGSNLDGSKSKMFVVSLGIDLL